MSLVVAVASHEAAKYACTTWHYSKCVPAGKLVKFGAWEDSKFLGVVLFSRGANSTLGQPYGCEQTECCELTRVALRDHQAPVSQIVARALRELKRTNPGLRLVISFADPGQGHHGGIYQAGGWIYAGRSEAVEEYIVRGVRYHGRSFRANFKPPGLTTGTLEYVKRHIDPNARAVLGTSKHRYLMPLDKGMRRRLQSFAQPYPPRVRGVNGDAPDVLSGEAGSIPAGRSTTTTRDR